MYDIIPIILILISLGAMIVIAVRKFPVLAALDVENMPQEKEAKFKEKIISNRLKRNIIKYSSRVIRILKPVGQGLVNFFKWAFNKLHEAKENYKAEPPLSAAKTEENIEGMINEAGELVKKEDFEAAEKNLIEAINIDAKNVPAFKALGDLYFKKKSYAEAKQTFEHVLKLIDGEDAEIYFNLSLTDKGSGDTESAVANIEKAIAIEPNNPRYIDTMLEISIINKDKQRALKAYEKMKQANPENQKLGDIKKEIDELA
jgi:tetratricopeptide (TPR) repeat protein